MKHEADKHGQALDPEVLDTLLEAQSPLPPPPGLRARVLERVRQATAHGFITARAVEGGWKPLAPGIEVKLLFTDRHAGTKSFLVRAQPGTSLPAHRHSGDEECLVLEGAFSMGALTLQAGDFHCAPAGSFHEPAIAITPVLVYLRGASADYPFV